MTITLATADIVQDDLPRGLAARASMSRLLAWDIETSGLDWSRDAIGTCQLAADDWAVVVVLRSQTRPDRLAALLEDNGVTKVFHHAPFDLRFMASQWGVRPGSVACTKVASKILDPHLDRAQHSLKPVLSRHLGIEISKEQQVSDWLAPQLTEAQLKYALTDVVYLGHLYEVLEAKCRDAGVYRDLVESFAYMPTRVDLDIRGSGDVFAY